MEISPYVFISYSRHDQVFVERLVDDLRQAGIEVWRDIEQISAGTNWQREIKQALLGASALLYVASRHSLESEYMKHELLYSNDVNRPIIPILVDDDASNNMPLALQVFQWVDFRLDYDVALRSIISALSNHISTKGPIEPKMEQSKGYVFLSYAEEDRDFVVTLKGFLRENGYAYWDYDESERDYHNQLFLELEGIIKEAAATLSVLSEAWKRSQWTVKEYFFSEEAGTPVFLLKAKLIGPTLAVAGIPYIDLVSDRDRGFEKLERELERKGL